MKPLSPTYGDKYSPEGKDMFVSDNSELEKLKNLSGKKTVIIGIGNPMKGDDGAGPELIRKLGGKNLPSDKFVLLDVGEVPENYLQKVVNEKPDTVLLVDIADMKTTPGPIRVLEYDDIIDNSLSTHNASLKLTMDYIKAEIDTKIYLVGIQPEKLGFGDPISPAVTNSIIKICQFLGSLY